MPRFLDTNILLRYFTGSPTDLAARAQKLLQRVERGEEKVVTSLMVLFETVFTLQRTYRVPKDDIRQMVTDVVSLPGVQVTGKRLFLRALVLYAQTSPLSLADAYNATYIQEQGLTEIYSWDTDFDAVPGITRLEPE